MWLDQGSTTAQWQSQESEFCSFWLKSLGKRAAEHRGDKKKGGKKKKATGIKLTNTKSCKKTKTQYLAGGYQGLGEWNYLQSFMLHLCYKINRSGIERGCFPSGLLPAVCTPKLSKISLSSKLTLPWWEAESRWPHTNSHAEQVHCGHNWACCADFTPVSSRPSNISRAWSLHK